MKHFDTNSRFLIIWILILAIWVCFLLASCTGQSAGVASVDAPRASPLPKILIIGDLKSIGWTPLVQQSMEGVADVIHAGNQVSGNLDTGSELANVSKYLAGGPFLFVHLDAETDIDPCYHHTNDLAVYLSNLTQLIERIRASGATPIFSTILPTASGALDVCHPAEKVIQYNAAAKVLMTALGVQVDDLWTVEEQDIPDYFTLPWYIITPAGNEAAAVSVVQSFGYIAR